MDGNNAVYGNTGGASLAFKKQIRWKCKYCKKCYLSNITRKDYVDFIQKKCNITCPENYCGLLANIYKKGKCNIFYKLLFYVLLIFNKEYTDDTPRIPTHKPGPIS
jgi:hypothetical protein